ncbi:hypothetical protein KY348_00815 [Candidatus Woesearchaeota archaeon]|nr:hypothetical protein [Candidatus Woesearchaeota archaeon]
MKLHISELELKFEGKSILNKDNTLVNELKVEDGDNTIFYLGEMGGLYFDSDLDVRGKVALSRRDKRIETVKKKRLARVFPPKIKVKEVPVKRKYLIWSFSTHDTEYMVYGGRSNWSSKCGYRSIIKKKALAKGIVLKDKLLDVVFGPMEREIMEWYYERADEKKKGK